MSDLKITPGEWKCRYGVCDNGEWDIAAEDPATWYVATCWPKADGADTEANARLIAASPDLFKAAKHALGLLRLIHVTAKPDSDATLDATIDALDAAIRKARGES